MTFKKETSIPSILSIISIIFSIVALFFTYHQNVLDEANLQLTINKEILKEQIIVCNNSNPEFISENKKIFSEASKQFKFGNYKDTITILKNFENDIPCIEILDYPYGTTKNNNFSFLTGAVTGLINSGAGVPAILFLMIVIAGTIILVVVRRRN